MPAVVYIYQRRTDHRLCSWFQLITCWAESPLHSLPAAAVRRLQTTHTVRSPCLSDSYSDCTCLVPSSHQSSFPSSPTPPPRSHQRAVFKRMSFFSPLSFTSSHLGPHFSASNSLPAVWSISLSSSPPLTQVPAFTCPPSTSIFPLRSYFPPAPNPHNLTLTDPGSKGRHTLPLGTQR